MQGLWKAVIGIPQQVCGDTRVVLVPTSPNKRTDREEPASRSFKGRAILLDCCRVHQPRTIHARGDEVAVIERYAQGGVLFSTGRIRWSVHARLSKYDDETLSTLRQNGCSATACE